MYPLNQLIAYARAHAPFYRRLYEGQADTPQLADLPVIDPPVYWAAHGVDRQEILTEIHQDGFVFNSGGTTGPPKHTYCTAQEWDASLDLSARSFNEAQMRDGDRVATLFASGNLYASLLFATESLKRVRVKVVQYPIGYAVPFPEIAKVIELFKINVLAGFPTHLLRVIDALDQEKRSSVHIDRIIYAGELFSADQQTLLQARFPGLQIHSAGYASVEGGPIGFADASCRVNEHRVFDGGTVIEILDEETSQPIEEVGRPGRVIFTSLARRLMPLIRYPTGDRAQWLEPAGSVDRKFLLLGRAGQSARFHRYNLETTVLESWLEPLYGKLQIEHLQMLVTRVNTFDQLTLRIVGRAAPEVLAAGSEEILEILRQRRPDVYLSVEAGVLHPPLVEWVSRDQLIVSERTGKMLAVVDRRTG